MNAFLMMSPVGIPRAQSSIPPPSGPQPRAVEVLIRSDPRLSALERQMGDVLAAAGRAAAWPGRELLAANQRVWLYTRRQCLAAADPIRCLAELYARRIADVSSKAGLPAARPPIRLRCDGDPPLGFTITYYATDPGTLVAEHRGEMIVMLQQLTASGVRYTWSAASYSEHQGVSWIAWPGQPRPLRCVR